MYRKEDENPGYRFSTYGGLGGSVEPQESPIHGLDNLMDKLPEVKPPGMSQDEWNVVVALRHTWLAPPRNWKEYCKKLDYCLWLVFA